MTTSDQIEQRLGQVFHAPPPPDMARAMDARIATLVRAGHAPANIRAPRRSTRLVVVAFAVVAMLATAAFGYELFQRMIGGEGWQLAWERSEYIGLPAVANGHEVILERAYADGAQVVLGVSAPSLGDALTHSTLTVTDETGATYAPRAGIGTNVVDGSAVLYVFEPDQPIAAGPRDFAVTMTRSGAPDPWSWTFPLTVAPATVVALNESSTVSEITVEVGSVTISPTTARITFGIQAGPEAPAAESWSPIGVLRSASVELPLTGGQPELLAHRGVDDAKGMWELVVTELVLVDDENGRVSVEGPWTIKFEVP